MTHDTPDRSAPAIGTALPPVELMRRALACVQRALELEVDARSDWLDSELGTDAALRAEVEALLAQDARADGTGPERLRASDDTLADPAIGRVVGRYRIEARIGSGGMGAIYRALPESGVARQPVALKLIKRGLDSEEIVRRFLAERDLLSRLDHPNIARLLDGGISDLGQPWFAMELVQGAPLIEACDRRQLDISARIRLFAGACAAVEHAHRHLIVHRDLKPSNVLLADSDQVKLVDFGIAKLIDGAAGGVTASGIRAMTPEYAAPEQFSGAQLTTQTDVYQLGALLYELLSGTRPSRADFAPAANLSQLAMSPAAAAARKTTPRALQRHLRGDLSRIVAQAMHPDLQRRYAEVAALRLDLMRYLAHEPVSATADRWSYRLRKFAQRHRVGVAAACSIVVSLGVGLGIALHEMSALRRTERQLESSLRIVEDVFLAADPYVAHGADTRARDLLSRARERIASGIAEQPELSARLLFEIGLVHVSLDEREAAEAAMGQALAAAELGQRADLAAQARARLAHFAITRDGDRERMAELDQAIATLRRDLPAQAHALARTLELKADALFNLGEFAAIPGIAAQMVQTMQQARGRNDGETALMLAGQASLLRGIGRAEEAMAPAAAAYAIAARPEVEIAEASRIYIEQQYGGALAYNQRAAESEAPLRDAYQRALRVNGANSNIALGLAYELAAVASELGQFDEVARLLQPSRERLDVLGEANVAAVENSIGAAELSRGDLSAALAAFGRAQAFFCADNAATPPCTIVTQNLVEGLIAAGRLDDAQQALTRVAATVVEGEPRIQRRQAQLRARLALARGDLVQARSALATAFDAQPPDQLPPAERAGLLLDRADVAAATGNAKAAAEGYRRAVELLDAQWRTEPPLLQRARAALRSQLPSG